MDYEVTAMEDFKDGTLPPEFAVWKKGDVRSVPPAVFGRLERSGGPGTFRISGKVIPPPTKKEAPKEAKPKKVAPKPKEEAEEPKEPVKKEVE